MPSIATRSTATGSGRGNGFPPRTIPPARRSGDWSAESTDEVNTIGGGIRFQLIPKRLDLDVRYSYSEVTGDIEFASPLGGAEDPNPYVPAAFPEMDNTKLHTLDAKLKYAIGKGFSLTIGYLWEKFDYDDFNSQGFTNVPTDDAGLYNGALLIGTLPKTTMSTWPTPNSPTDSDSGA